MKLTQDTSGHHGQHHESWIRSAGGSATAWSASSRPETSGPKGSGHGWGPRSRPLIATQDGTRAIAANFELAPPPKTVEGLLAVPIDISSIEAAFTFDGATSTATADHLSHRHHDRQLDLRPPQGDRRGMAGRSAVTAGLARPSHLGRRGRDGPARHRIRPGRRLR